jgi:carboxymethylenebutenolidase
MTPDASEAFYLARPAQGEGSGELVIHAWWGLTGFFTGICDRLAAEGFVALAPDLYHGATTAKIEEAEKLRSRLHRDAVAQQITQAAQKVQSLSNRPAIGVLGFSLGGYWALWLAEQPDIPVSATVVFYGSRSGEYSAGLSAFQFHLVESDDYVADSGVKKLKKALAAAGQEAEFYTYPGTHHWFLESDRPDAYNAAAAHMAWGRTVTFLKAPV